MSEYTITRVVSNASNMIAIGISAYWCGGPWWHFLVIMLAITLTNVLGFAEGTAKYSGE